MKEITRRQFVASAAMAPQPVARKRTNLLVFMTDQESALLPGPVETPNRARIERDGVRFTSAFCNTPQCSPARSSLLTGLEPHETGVLTNVDGESLGKPLPASIPTIGSVFAKAGYATGYFGKWHLGGRKALGFDFTGGDRGDDAVAAEAAAWIAKQREPWFAWVSVLNPHDIYSLRDVPPRPGVRPPASDLRNLASKPAEQQEYADKDQGKATANYTPEDWIRYRSFYCQLVEKADANFGTVLKSVADLDSTVVAYTSDHGDALGEHGLPFKGPFMYEELLRIPLVVRAAGMAAGTRDHFTTQADLAPMLAGLCGVEWTPKRSRHPDDAVFLEYYAKQKWVNPIRTIRTRRWKLNWYDSGHQELYDLTADPHELRTVKSPTVQSQLEKRLNAWRGIR